MFEGETRNALEPAFATRDSHEKSDDSVRIDFLDGIRGWASIVVLLSHLIGAFLALTNPFLRQLINYSVDDLVSHLKADALLSGGAFFTVISHLSLRFFTDGDLAVRVFFVLSGFVLSIKQLSLRTRNLPLATTSRYFRLMIPILVTSLIAYMLLRAGFLQNLRVATTPERSSEWLGTFYKFEPSLLSAVKFSIFDTFFDYQAPSSYNEVLWMMPMELFGSYVIFGFLAIFRNDRLPYLLIGVIIPILIYASPMLACFFFGYVLAELYMRQIFLTMQSRIPWIEIVTIGFFILISIVSTHMRNNEPAVCIMAVVIVACIVSSTNLTRLFSARSSVFLGRISFPLYLMQLPIICSWSSFLFIWLEDARISQNVSAMLITISTVLLCIAAGVCLSPVDRFSVRYSRIIADGLLR